MSEEYVSPWARVTALFEEYLAAIKRDPMQMEPETRQAARDYQQARAHANEIAPKAKPSRIVAVPPSKRRA